jgi:hypothetical protein
MKESVLLTVDGALKLLAGILLIIFPKGLAHFLGLPMPATWLYSMVLGGVLVGIGGALVMQQLMDRPIAARGIELPIVMNFAGAGALIGALVARHLDLPLNGDIFLWIVVVAVLIMGAGEIILHVRQVGVSRQQAGGRLHTRGQEHTPVG